MGHLFPLHTGAWQSAISRGSCARLVEAVSCAVRLLLVRTCLVLERHARRSAGSWREKCARRCVWPFALSCLKLLLECECFVSDPISSPLQADWLALRSLTGRERMQPKFPSTVTLSHSQG